jgi:SAM-dependent methyltransferase
MTQSRSADHFRRIYAAGPDPWHFETSAYEQAKYHATLAVLKDRRFASALEVGCSIGVLTRMLSDRCDTTLGIDLLDDPLQAARRRCAGRPVSFETLQVPQSWPNGPFDLIVFSEVLYFLDRPDIVRSAEHARRTSVAGGTIVLVNWLGQTDDPCSGDEAAGIFIEAGSGWLRHETTRREPGYRIDVLRTPDLNPATPSPAPVPATSRSKPRRNTPGQAPGSN